MNRTAAPEVSFVIVSWNAKRFLEKCLGSLDTSVCGVPMEVIVVDNGSEDGSAEMVRERFGQVRLVVNSCNEGFARANNRGILMSRGNYVCLVNSDVEFRAGVVDRLLQYLESHQDVGMAGPMIVGADGRLQRSCRGFPSLGNMLCRALALDTLFPYSAMFSGYSMNWFDHATEKRVDILSGCFLLIRRDALNDVGLLDEGFFIYGEDMDWCLRFAIAGWDRAFVPAAMAIHFGGASSANAPLRFLVEMQKADLRYWRKHHGFVSSIAYFAISCARHFGRLVGYSIKWIWCGKDERRRAGAKARRGGFCLLWMLTGYLHDDQLRASIGAPQVKHQKQLGLQRESIGPNE